MLDKEYCTRLSGLWQIFGKTFDNDSIIENIDFSILNVLLQSYFFHTFQFLIFDD